MDLSDIADFKHSPATGSTGQATKRKAADITEDEEQAAKRMKENHEVFSGNFSLLPDGWTPEKVASEVARMLAAQEAEIASEVVRMLVAQELAGMTKELEMKKRASEIVAKKEDRSESAFGWMTAERMVAESDRIYSAAKDKANLTEAKEKEEKGGRKQMRTFPLNPIFHMMVEFDSASTNYKKQYLEIVQERCRAKNLTKDAADAAYQVAVAKIEEAANSPSLPSRAEMAEETWNAHEGAWLLFRMKRETDRLRALFTNETFLKLQDVFA